MGVGRSGVAATLASVAIFTMMLVANAALYSSQTGYLDAVRLSAAQVQETGYAGVLSGVSAYSALAQTQSMLEATPMDCSAWQGYLSSLSGGGTFGGTDGGVIYSAQSSWSYTASASSPGDPLVSAGFDGYAQGELNLKVSTSVSETYLGGLPSLATQAVHVVHLPVQPAAASSRCLTALSELAESLSAGSCNSSLIAGEVSRAVATFPLLASFEVGASPSPSPSPDGGRCSVSYWVRTSLAETGVSGTFQWTVFAAGTLST